MSLEKLLSGLRPKSSEDMFSFFEKCRKEAESIVLERNEKGEILAPNGMPSELRDELLCKLTRTKSFKKRFGASRVVYATGEPKIVFHSTPSDIPFSEGLSPEGSVVQSDILEDGQSKIYFSDDMQDARHWGERNKHRTGTSENTVVYPCFLIITKPHPRFARPGEGEGQYDGYIQPNAGGSRATHYAVVKKNQIIHLPFTPTNLNQGQE